MRRNCRNLGFADSLSRFHSPLPFSFLCALMPSVGPNDDIVPARMTTTAGPPTSRKDSLNQNQIRGFWAAWGGWALDGMDSFIYALVLVPSLRELLPRSGIPATKGDIGFYGGVLVRFFFLGLGGGVCLGG